MLNLSRWLCIVLCTMMLTAGCGKKKPAVEERRLSSGSSSTTGTDGSNSGWITANDGTSTEGSANTRAPGETTLDGSTGSMSGGTNAGSTGAYAEKFGGESGQIGVAISDLPNVNFALDSYEIDANSLKTIESNATYLKSNSLQVILRGHTDDSGTEEYNFSLGSQRAQAVREALIGLGVSADRLETISFGESMPLAEGEDEATRSQNRRVEFFVYEKP